MSNKKNGANGRGVKSDFSRCARTRLLTRIIVYLKEVNPNANHSNMAKNIMSARNGSVLADALNWLISNKIICKRTTSVGARKIYFINPNWEKLKNG